MRKYQVTCETVKGLRKELYIEAANKADAKTKAYQEGVWKVTGIRYLRPTNGPEHLDIYYFAYGSNLHKRHMKGRCQDSQPVAQAVAWGYTLTFRGNTKGQGVADIQPKDDDFVPGAIYKVSALDRAALDRYEGYPRLYDRHEITVIRQDTGEPVRAFVYRMLDHYRPTPPGDYYFNIIAEGYQDWDMDDFLEELELLRYKLERMLLSGSLRRVNA